MSTRKDKTKLSKTTPPTPPPPLTSSASTLPFEPAVFMTTDAVSMGNRLMGRQSAGKGFLRAFQQMYHPLRTTGQRTHPLRLISNSTEHQEFLQKSLKEMGWQHEISYHTTRKIAEWPQDMGVLHFPAPVPASLAWQRERSGRNHLALCGLTHTICTDAAMRLITDMIAAPFAEWDALICTSTSVQHAVAHMWEAQIDYLKHRLGTSTLKPKRPMTPVIPLGVHLHDFESSISDRVAGRAQWGFGVNDIVLLFVGRLSLHAKANPFPMYLAAKRAAVASGKTVKVLECGWFAGDAVKNAYDEAARLAGIDVIRCDGREAGITQRAYASSDIFISLSDNIQETFGLTPLEAMAAGLPVVVSEWDGYRDTVRHGVDGFLVKSHLVDDPAAARGLIEGFEDGVLNYDHYIAHTHVLVSIDIDECAKALVQLIENPELRKTMGAAGRERVRQQFDWSVVMKQYEALWREQNDRRPKPSMPAVKQPMMLNPLELFKHYASSTVNNQTLLWRNQARQATGEMVALGTLRGWSSASQARRLGMWGFAQTWLPDGTTFDEAVELLPVSGSGMSVEQWAQILKQPTAKMQRMAVWLHKVGVVKTQTP